MGRGIWLIGASGLRSLRFEERVLCVRVFLLDYRTFAIGFANDMTERLRVLYMFVL